MASTILRVFLTGCITCVGLSAAPPKGETKKGDLTKEFERVAKPPKKKADRPENNYNPPGPGPSKPKGPAPK